jgi:hypothetical protein
MLLLRGGAVAASHFDAAARSAIHMLLLLRPLLPYAGATAAIQMPLML